MTKEEFTAHKAEAIFESLKNTATAVIKNAKSSKPIEEKQVNQLLIWRAGKIDLACIMSQPFIPSHYKPGA